MVDLNHQLGRDLQTAWPGMTTVVDLRAMAEVLIDRWASRGCPQQCRFHIDMAGDSGHLSVTVSAAALRLWICKVHGQFSAHQCLPASAAAPDASLRSLHLTVHKLSCASV